jgi:YegS/Rv2252/BmrU family lipid kinase
MIRSRINAANIQVVVNPVAGSGKAEKIAGTLIQDISKISDALIRMTFTEKAGDATFITRKAIQEGSDMIIAVGGDGTINEVVNGFFIDGLPVNPDCELGIISCGTGRGFGNGILLPREVDRQIGLLINAQSIPADVGRIIYKSLSGETSERLFINECQTGIGSKVASVVGKKHKSFGGPIAFGISATIQAIILKPLLLDIEFDNDPVREYKLIGLVTGNGTECAGGMKLTPDAKIDDGFLDVLMISNMNVAKRLMNLTKVYSGTHLLSPYFSVKRCKKLNVRSESPALIEADGEILGNSPFTIEIIPASIKIKTGFKNST